MTYHPAPRPGASVALRVLTGQTATKEQRKAAEALLADVMPDEQRVEVHGATVQRMTLDAFNAKHAKPALRVGPTFWQLVDLGLLALGAMGLLGAAFMLIEFAMVVL